MSDSFFSNLIILIGSYVWGILVQKKLNFSMLKEGSMLKNLKKLAVATFILTLSSVSLGAEKEWTFLTYLNGNNNLDSFGARDINEMETIGSTDRINVVVQWASRAATTTKRLYIHQDNQIGVVTSPVVDTLPRVDMGDYKNLVEFVRWGMMNYPAKKYFVNVWDHGGGWHTPASGLMQLFKSLGGGIPFTEGQFTPSDISWDDFSGHFITTEQLGVAMTESAQIIGHKVDIYGSDACLMAMPEVSTEMSNSVQMYVGSQETEPGPGWDYAGLLKGWSALADMSALNVSKVLTDTYVASYTGGSQGSQAVTFSAFDLTQTQSLLLATKALGEGLIALPAATKLKVKNAIGLTQAFYYNDYGDALDLIKLMQQAGIGTDLRPGILSTANDALKGFISYNKASSYYAKATGASFWVPKTAAKFDTYWARYQKLQFQQQTGWGNALQAILK
jgi:hypothetical protein